MSTSVDTTTPARRKSTTPNSPAPSPQFVDTAPSPGRLAVAIAGYPYTITAAISDIADNSIEAGASRIAILMKKTGAIKDAIVFVDDGGGIAPNILDEVLRAGSRTESLYSRDSLSRYGFGLKGAGASVGHKITVLTRYAGEPLRRRSIDFEDIMASDVWRQETRVPTPEETAYFEWAMTQLPGDAGVPQTATAVIIEKLNPRRKPNVASLVRTLGETYAKFLAREGAGAGLLIRVDDRDILPTDPLHRDYPLTLTLYSREEIVLDSGATLIFSSVVLPHPSQVPPETRTQFRYSTANQGFYIYRNGRLIAGGEKLNLFKPDFHRNNFRAELMYTTAADEDITVDVAKSTIQLSAEAESKLHELVQTSLRTADTLWREKDVLTEEDIRGLFDESNRLIASKAKLLAKRVDPKTGKITHREPPPAPPQPSRGGVTPHGASNSDTAFLRPSDTLPFGILYRPVYDGEIGSVVVEVNLSHPFSKAVFSVPPEADGKRKVARQATTAVQQLLYILGATEYAFPMENTDLFEQYRKLASLNLGAIVG